MLKNHILLEAPTYATLSLTHNNRNAVRNTS